MQTKWLVKKLELIKKIKQKWATNHAFSVAIFSFSAQVIAIFAML